MKFEINLRYSEIPSGIPMTMVYRVQSFHRNILFPYQHHTLVRGILKHNNYGTSNRGIKYHSILI